MIQFSFWLIEDMCSESMWWLCDCSSPFLRFQNITGCRLYGISRGLFLHFIPRKRPCYRHNCFRLILLKSAEKVGCKLSKWWQWGSHWIWSMPNRRWKLINAEYCPNRVRGRKGRSRERRGERGDRTTRIVLAACQSPTVPLIRIRKEKTDGVDGARFPHLR